MSEHNLIQSTPTPRTCATLVADLQQLGLHVWRSYHDIRIDVDVFAELGAAFEQAHAVTIGTRTIIELLRKKQSDYTDDDVHEMSRVVSYVHRHMAQRPAGDVTDTRWRYSLMNWGHDPLKK